MQIFDGHEIKHLLAHLQREGHALLRSTLRDDVVYEMIARSTSLERCISWCPVWVDKTAEVEAQCATGLARDIAESDHGSC